jgi:hypothetical protein
MCRDGWVYVEDENAAKLDIGEADAYGYLVEVREGEIRIQGALYDAGSGPVPIVEVKDRCGLFDERMEAYVQRFIRST